MISRTVNIFLFLISCTSLSAQISLPPQPVDTDYGGRLTVQLVTIDPGDPMTTWWGHTAIIVSDSLTGNSQFFNYGLFSFERDNFILNFARGRLIFWVGVWDTQAALDHYKRQNRNIRIQTFNLSPQKKAQLSYFLNQNILPENRDYLYDHYYDNCATRVRDIFDSVTGGALKQQSNTQGRMSFREHTRRHTDHAFFTDWLLMFLMNSTIDQPVLQWDEMFLPTEMENQFERLLYTNEAGERVSLVSESIYYFKAQDRKPLPTGAPRHWPWMLILVIPVCAVIVLLYIFPRTVYRRKIRALIQTATGLLYGVPGTVLFLMATLTDHRVTYYNENLFLTNPAWILVIVFGISLYRDGNWHKKGNQWLWYLLAASGLLLLLLKAVLNLQQDNWLAIVTILPISISFAFGEIYLRIKEVNNQL